MHILETYRNSKTGNLDCCEDRFIYTDDFVILVDGMTSKDNRSWNGKKGGLIAAEMICDEVSSFPADISLHDAMKRFTAKIASFYQSKQLYDQMAKNPALRIAASLVIYSRNLQEIWMIGDCQCMVDDRVYTHEKLIDQVMGDARAMYLDIELLKGKSIAELRAHDTGRELIMPLMKNQPYFQNLTNHRFAYEVIDGFPVNESLIQIIKVPESAEVLIFASDGYPMVKKSLEETEMWLARILKEDPLCFQEYKSTKGLVEGQISYDDRSYVKFNPN